MRVCIDAVPLLLRSAGVKNYLYHLIRHLWQTAPAGSLSLFPWLREPRRLDHERSSASLTGTLARLASLHFLNVPGNHLMDLLGGDPDVFHACKLLNTPRRAKLTATIHDSTTLLAPEWHMPDVVRYESAFTERILRCADGVIAVSNCTRDDAVRLLNLNPDKVHVIYHGVDEPYFR